ncbi:MAG: glycosyl hydrolase [Planctomycetaceae bacterium]|nr:MAG: glycosyl hydrolase [Planctomycetaceae bacterium]
MWQRDALWSGWLVAVTLSASLVGAAEPSRVKALFLTQSAGFKHRSVDRQGRELAPAEIAIVQLGQQTGLFDVHCTQDAAADFTRDNLKNYQLIMFYTTLDLPIKSEDLEYFLKEWLTTKGHAFVGFHSATDTFHNYQPYWDMIGGTFNGHPWNAGETVTISIHDREHPATKPLGAELVIQDEIYQYKNYQPHKVRVLMSLDMSKCSTKRPYMVPVSWVKHYGEGRVFYTNLGHNEKTWTNPQFLAHITGGIRWALNLEEGSAEPNPDLQQQLEEKAKRDAAQ